MNKESYFIVNIQFCDIDIEQTESAQCLIKLNGELDDSLCLGNETTLFVHKKDLIRCEIKTQKTANSVGFIEIDGDYILKKQQSKFQQWFKIQSQDDDELNSQNINILLGFSLQKLENKLNRGEDNLRTQIFDEISNQKIQRQDQDTHSPDFLNISKAYKKQFENDLLVEHEEEEVQSMRKKESNVEKINKNSSFNINNNYNKTGQKLSSYQVIEYTDQEEEDQKEKSRHFQNKNSYHQNENKSFHLTQEQGYQNQNKIDKYKLGKIREQIFQFEDRITFLQLNNKKQHLKFQVLKRKTQLMSELADNIQLHPCKSCENKYLPKIKILQNEISEQLILLENKQNRENNQIKSVRRVSNNQKQQDQQQISMTSRRISPLQQSQQNIQIKNEQSKIKNVDNLIQNYRESQMQKQILLEHQSLKIQKLENENESLKQKLMISVEINEQQKNESEYLNQTYKKLKFRNFLVESDLKTFLRKMDIENSKPEDRIAYKLKEFRAIYDFLIKLKIQNDRLINQLDETESQDPKQEKIFIKQNNNNKNYQISNSKRQSDSYEEYSNKNKYNNIKDFQKFRESQTNQQDQDHFQPQTSHKQRNKSNITAPQNYCLYEDYEEGLDIDFNNITYNKNSGQELQDDEEDYLKENKTKQLECPLFKNETYNNEKQNKRTVKKNISNDINEVDSILQQRKTVISKLLDKLENVQIN